MGFKSGSEWNGNAKGRPEGSISVVSALKRELAKVPKDKTNKDKKTYLELLIKTIFEKSIDDKDVSMIKDVIDRVDGKPINKTDLTSKGEKIMIMPSEIMEKNNIESNESEEKKL